MTKPRNLGFGPLLPLRESMSNVILFPHPASGFARNLAYYHAILSPSWSIMGFSRRAPLVRRKPQPPFDEVCEHHSGDAAARQPHALFGYLLGYLRWAGRWRRSPPGCARARGETVAFLGLLDTRRRKRKTGGKKEANALNPDVRAEIERERAASSPLSREMPEAFIIYRH